MPARRVALFALAAPVLAPLLALHLPTHAATVEDTPVYMTTVPGPFRADAESLKTYRTPGIPPNETQ